MSKGSYRWACKGCLIKAGFDPDKVTESTLGRFGNLTCEFCGHIQDESWFKHVCDSEVIEKLELMSGHAIKVSLTVASEHDVCVKIIEIDEPTRPIKFTGSPRHQGIFDKEPT